MLILEIAGGILLAVFILAALPFLFSAATWIFGGVLLVGVAAAALIGAGLVLHVVSTNPIVAFVVALAFGVFFVWLYFEIKARREAAAEVHAEDAALKTPANSKTLGTLARKFGLGWFKMAAAIVYMPVQQWRFVQAQKTLGSVISIGAALEMVWALIAGTVISFMTIVLTVLALEPFVDGTFLAAMK
jgi:hypothetical protein